ncbi:gliding motility protein GldN [Phnomibacter sp. MR]|uniref:type IX secretion system ring protein PorN/GldN n=1 Tax=Phnomibacter sp. MR TaxID=3042318 RepID=UPI003A807F31
MMKRISWMVLLLAGLVATQDALAQKKPVKKAKPKTTNTKQPAVVNTPVVAPVVDTPKVEEKDTIPVKAVVPSRRPTSTVEGNLTLDKTPLQYDHIRIDDQVYKQIVWREINVKEKMNLPFTYEADEDNGNQKFFNILLRHIKDGDITAFSNANDRFTTPLKVEDIAIMLMGKKYTISKPDLVLDPDMSKGIMKDTTIRDEFNENTIIAYRVKEEIIFDRETSRLHFRILGIAPVRAVLNDDGSFRDSYTLFWLYYPELRPILARYEAYNPRNMGMRMSWEEIFESRYFSSYITKSTLNNPFDKALSGYIADPLMRLLEGENIRETIFNWEQNQWSY